MSDWTEGKLGDVITVKYGKDHKTLGEGKIPVLGSGGVMRYADKSLYDKKSILIPRKGSLNNIMYRDEPFWTVDTMFWTIVNEDKVAPKYLFYQLTQIDFNNLNVGSAVPSLTVPVINEIDVTLPPLTEQKAIASVLSSLDDKIDLLHRQNQTLEAMAEALFKEWFVEDKNNKLMYYGDLVNSVSVKHSFDTDKVVFLNTSDIYNGHVLVHEYKEVRGLPGQAKKSIRKGDILFTEIRPANKRFAFINFDADDYVVSTKLMVLRSKGLISNSILYLYLKWLPNLEYLQMLAETRSGTFPQITFDDLKTVEINIPPQGIMDNLTPTFNSIIAKTFSNYDQIQTLTKLRDILLLKLMSGEVRVKI